MRMFSNKGFTLPELMVAVLILAIALTGLLLLFVNCTLLIDANRNSSIANSHLRYILEEIRGTNFTGLETRITGNNGTVTGWDFTTAQIQAYGLSPLTSENITTSVTQSGNPLGVSVTANWLDKTKKARSAQLQTLITNFTAN